MSLRNIRTRLVSIYIFRVSVLGSRPLVAHVRHFCPGETQEHGR